MASSNDSAPAIRASEVGKVYGRRAALSRVSFTIHEGETVAVVGPSGAGKTTLLHLLAGIIRPDGGDIHLNGRDLAGLTPGEELSRLVGVIHQQLDLVPQLSVLQNVLAGRLGHWGLARSVVSLVRPRERETAEMALDRVGLADKLYERTSRLSGGEQQRVAIARLLLQDPQVILADEPVASLDPVRAADLMGLLAEIAGQSGKTLVSSLHSIDLVRKHFSRLIGLRNGGQLFDLPSADVTGDMMDRLYDLRGIEKIDAFQGRDYGES